MARASLRDRFFTPKVAHAVTSPSGILLAGAGVAVGVAVGWPILAAVGLGAAAWAGRVAAAVPGGVRPDGPELDPLSIKEPWRRYVWEATKDRHRFDSAIRDIREGPLRTRLESIAARIDDAVAESYRVARSGQDLEAARRAIDVEGARADLARLGGPDAARQHPPDSHLGRTAAAFQAQIDTAARLETTIAELHDRLGLLDARLGEAVSRAIELSVRSGSESVHGLGGLDADVGSLVGELEALRQALDETSSAKLAPGEAPPPLPQPAPPPQPSSETRTDPPQAEGGQSAQGST